ncbi:unnamed protein product [Trichobilharzia regenti]|nr:unnamed protein product [Trichobilharzia regenti]
MSTSLVSNSPDTTVDSFLSHTITMNTDVKPTCEPSSGHFPYEGKWGAFVCVCVCMCLLVN